MISTLAAVGLLFSPTLAGAASSSSERVEHGRGERERGPGIERPDDCDESSGPGRRDERFDGDRSAPSSSAPGDDVDGENGCTLPPPVVPEAPWPVLLPLSAAGTAMIVLRRRGRPLVA